MNKIISFIKAEPVLAVAALAAIISCFFVLPSVNYFGYIDYKVLLSLLCLMLTVQGLSKLDVFRYAANKFLKKVKTFRTVAVLLIAMCFVLSMFITNDVALLTFVPFTLLILSLSGGTKYAPLIVVFETIAANLGSALTPVGNPQNLYIYSYYNMNTSEFFGVTIPFVLISAVLVMLGTLFVPNLPLGTTPAQKIHITSKKRLSVYILLFVLCLLGVFDIVPYVVSAFIVVLAVVLLDRSLFTQIDISLLVTFVCFFIFVGNLSAIPSVASILSKLTEGRELITGALLSQVISNVPAAVLLSGFTNNARGLLLGVNAGGCGTLIASLASLISYKLFCRELPHEKSKYFRTFTLWNVVFFVVITAVSYVIL